MKCKHESSLKAKEVVEEPAADFVEPMHDEDITLLEDSLEPPAADDGWGMHDEQVINNLWARAIQAMAEQDVSITEEENHTALSLFPKVSYWFSFEPFQSPL